MLYVEQKRIIGMLCALIKVREILHGSLHIRTNYHGQLQFSTTNSRKLQEQTVCCCMLSWEATNTNFIIFGLIRTGSNPRSTALEVSHYKNSTKRVSLVQSGSDHHLKINLFSPFFSWNIAELVLNSNHSLSFVDICFTFFLHVLGWASYFCFTIRVQSVNFIMARTRYFFDDMMMISVL
jgi:hypothetical protein